MIDGGGHVVRRLGAARGVGGRGWNAQACKFVRTRGDAGCRRVMARTITSSLESRLWRSNAQEFGAQALLLFAAAGTFRYWQAWTVLALRVVPYIFANVYLIRHDRELLRRRLAVEEEGETETVHKVVFALIVLLGLALPFVAGLDRRFGWSHVPLPVVLAACAVPMPKRRMVGAATAVASRLRRVSMT